MDDHALHLPAGRARGPLSSVGLSVRLPQAVDQLRLEHPAPGRKLPRGELAAQLREGPRLVGPPVRGNSLPPPLEDLCKSVPALLGLGLALFEALCQAAEGDSICEPIGDGVLLRVIVKPGQDEDAVLDVKDYCAMVSLRAPIEDRWCNQALLAFCRRALHVPQRERNAVKITDGDESLDKIVHIPALTPKEVIKRLHKKKDFEVDTNDVEKWIRHTERKQKEEERRMKRRKWA